MFGSLTKDDLGKLLRKENVFEEGHAEGKCLTVSLCSRCVLTASGGWVDTSHP